MKPIASTNAIHPLKYSIKLKYNCSHYGTISFINNNITMLSIYIFIYITYLLLKQIDVLIEKGRFFLLCVCIAIISVYKLYEIIKLFHS